MTVILSLPESLRSRLPKLCNDSDLKAWCFKKKLLAKVMEVDGVAFFSPFIYEYDSLLIIYAIHCSVIAKTLQSSSQIDPSDEAFEAHLVNALALANLLQVLSGQYLNSPQECHRLEKEEVVLRLMLCKFGYQFEWTNHSDLNEADENYNQPVSKWFREKTASVNWPRLLIVRVKRVLDTMVPISKGLPNFVNAINFIDELANPVFSYLAWVFYVPRFSLNAFLLLKNVIPHPWMNIRQQQLGLYLRFKSQIHDKWFELGNDGVWLGVGLINCFLLVGPYAPFAINLTVALYSFDVIFAAIRANVELGKLHKLKTLLIDLSKNSPHSKELNIYLNELDQAIQYESQRLGLSLITTIGLFVGMLFALPIFAGYPIIPFVSASFIVTLCIGTFLKGKSIEKQKPSKPLPILSDEHLKIYELDPPHKNLSKASSDFFGSINKSVVVGDGNDKVEMVKSYDDAELKKNLSYGQFRFHSHACKSETPANLPDEPPLRVRLG